MKLTTRGRFAVTSMIDLALYGDAGPVRLSDIARRQQISVAYLEQIFCKLRRAELVHSFPGKPQWAVWQTRIVAGKTIMIRQRPPASEGVTEPEL